MRVLGEFGGAGDVRPYLAPLRLGAAYQLRLSPEEPGGPFRRVWGVLDAVDAEDPRYGWFLVPGGRGARDCRWPLEAVCAYE